NDADLEQLIIPTNIPNPIDNLVVYHDGHQCERCHYICRSKLRMQTHCRQEHGWVNPQRRGHTMKNQRRMGVEMERSWKEGVYCQRFFTTGHGQGFFEVQPVDATEENAMEASVPKWDQARIELSRTWDAIKEREQRIIQEGFGNEVNPWLERTGWQSYLAGLDRDQLLHSIAKPDPEEEPIAVAIWETMGELIRFCQTSVIDRVGSFVRFDAIRTEKHQTRYQPLKPYKELPELERNSRPWQEILMFITRTQKEHTWKSPEYELNQRQTRAWSRVVEEANLVAEEKERRAEEEEEEEEEEDEIREELTDAQRACLRFCMALLDQAVNRHEYESPLVCAMAVLGVTAGGWKGPDQYPPHLSAMIKVNRFMVVQQALELDAREKAQGVHGVGCIQHVHEMMDRFMVRGSHSPMQWMLDLRTYGLKIHYNTTAEGNVDWMRDRIIYKKVEFGMADFRGMVHGLAAETQRILRDDLMFVSDDQAMPAIPWDTLRDNPRNNQAGWSFVQDERNAWEVDGEWWLFNRIGQNARLQRRFSQSGPEFRWDRNAVEEYMARVVEFREKLLALIHITGGC
ncbi:MAG: hypothetical protein MMC33_010895, partial [Icmadophila ericetorum]|nr:hypothetical protein [Icmadophila ericetorum]